MPYPKTHWKPYGESLKGYQVEINIKEVSGMKLEHFLVYTEKAYQQVLRTIKEKYNFSFPIEIKEIQKHNSRTSTTTLAQVNIMQNTIEEKELTEEQKKDLEMLKEINR